MPTTTTTPDTTVQPLGRRIANQLYIRYQPEDAQSAVISVVQQCFSVIEQLMAANRLRLIKRAGKNLSL